MAMVLYFAVFLIALILLIVAGVFATKAAVDVARVKDYGKDPDLSHAHKYLTASAVMTWVSVGLGFIVLIIGFSAGVYFSPGPAHQATFETVSKTATGGHGIGGTSMIVLTVITTILLLMTGILSAVAASDMKKSKVAGELYKSGYNSAITAAVIAIGSIGLFVIGMIVYFVSKGSETKKAAAVAALSTTPVGGGGVGGEGGGVGVGGGGGSVAADAIAVGGESKKSI